MQWTTAEASTISIAAPHFCSSVARSNTRTLAARRGIRARLHNRFVAGSAVGDEGAAAGTTVSEVEKNPYEVLGLDITASSFAIKKAYRAISKSAHPDSPTGSREAFEALKEAVDLLGDENRRLKLDAKLMGLAVTSLQIEELRISRELRGLEEQEDSGEVRSAEEVVAAAHAYAAAEKALARLEARKKKEEALVKQEKKQAALERAKELRRLAADRAYDNRMAGGDARATLVLTRENAAAGGEHEVTAEVESNCPKCLGWGEKEGHWTLAMDKLCPRCEGGGRVLTPKKVKIFVPGGTVDGYETTVAGVGNGGYSKQLNVLGEMGPPGETGDLIVSVVVLRKGEVYRES